MMRRVLVVLLLVLALPTACSRPRATNDTSGAQRAMALLGTARALHHEADLYETQGDFSRASAAMRRVLALQLPADFADAEDVRADAWGRIAELDLRQERPDEALAHIAEGLRATPRESVLQARLFMVRGQALRALSERSASSGDASAAARQREEALAALERSIAINARILRRLTPGARR